MDRVEITVRKMLLAIEAPFYDVGVLSHSGMLPGLDSIPAKEVLTRLSLLKYRNARGSHIYIRPSGEHWRRFGRLPGFTNCKTKYQRLDGLFPFVRLKSNSGQQYPMADNFAREITRLYAERESERERKRLQAALSPHRGRTLSALSLERFRTSSKYQDRPAAADIAFCVAALGNGMPQDQVARALENNYLSRDPSPAKRAAYIKRTIEKASNWTGR